MKAGWPTILPRLALVVAALSTAPGCSSMVADAVTSTTGSISDTINQRDVKSHAVRSIKTIAISRIAVMPVVEDAAGGDPLAPGAAEAISADCSYAWPVMMAVIAPASARPSFESYGSP